MDKGRVRRGESGEDGGAKGAEQLDSEEMEEDTEERRGVSLAAVHVQFALHKNTYFVECSTEAVGS